MDVLPDAMQLDCPKLDGDHVVLLSLIEDLTQIVAEGAERDKVADLVLELAAYFDAHFENEEQLMAQSGYSVSGVHLREHESMRVQFALTVKKLEMGELAMASGMLTMLRAWVGTHIQLTDRALAAHLVECGMQGREGERMTVFDRAPQAVR